MVLFLFDQIHGYEKSAGILPNRLGRYFRLEVFLVPHGGPFWQNKGMGTWSISKGEFEEEKLPFDAARRELLEKTGFVCKGNYTELTPLILTSGKLVFAWAVNMGLPAGLLQSNFFELEWPPHSKKFKKFPEIDKAKLFSALQAREKINGSQIPFLDEQEKRMRIDFL